MHEYKPFGWMSWKLLGALVLLLALASAALAQSAPDFTLPDVKTGQNYSLSQFKGKVVLLNFFTFLCEPCRREMPLLNQIDAELKGRGYQTLGIGLASSQEQLKALAQQLGLNYPVLAGNDQVQQAYGNVALVPLTLIIDRQGRVVQKILGERSKEEFLKMIQPLL